MSAVSGDSGKLEEIGAWTEGSSGYAEGDWVLPGFGESHPECGEVVAGGVCDECGYVDWMASECGRRECPKCWSSSWRRSAARGAAERLAQFRAVAGEGIHRRTVHAVVSPPEGNIKSKQDVEALRSEAQEKAREHGVRGGVSVFHAFRATDEAKAAWGKAQDCGFEKGIWAWIREREEPRRWMYWSPHVHIIGLARDFQEATGEGEWVVKNVGSLGEFHLREESGYEDMYRVLMYLLSHTTYDETRENAAPVLRYFGELSTSSFTNEEKPEPWVCDVIEEMLRRVSGVEEEREEEGEGGLEPCPCEECEGAVIDAHKIDRYLSYPESEPPPEALARMRAVRDWVLGRRLPPPGLKHPRTEEEAEEALEAML